MINFDWPKIFVTWFLFVKIDQKISIYSSISQKKKRNKEKLRWYPEASLCPDLAFGPMGHDGSPLAAVR